MADIYTTLESYLKTITAVTDLVGTGDNARIYLEEAKPDAQLPYVVMEVFDAGSAEDLQGPVGMATNRVQIDAYGEAASDSFTLAEAIRLAPLQGFSGTMAGAFIDDVSSSGGYSQGADRPSKGSNTKRYWTSRDYLFNHKEATQ